MPVRDTVLQELKRHAVTRRGITADAVVERPNVIEPIGISLGTGRVAPAVRPFDFQAAKVALDGCIFSAPAVAAHQTGFVDPNTISGYVRNHRYSR